MLEEQHIIQCDAHGSTKAIHRFRGMRSRSSRVVQSLLCRNQRGCPLRRLVWLEVRGKTKDSQLMEHDRRRDGEALLASRVLRQLGCPTPLLHASHDGLQADRGRPHGIVLRFQNQSEEPAAMVAISAAYSRLNISTSTQAILALRLKSTSGEGLLNVGMQDVALPDLARAKCDPVFLRRALKE